MKIEIIRPCSFCKGVVKAIKLVEKTINDYPSHNIYILGMLVHNEKVVERLTKLGAITLLGDKKQAIDSIASGVVIFSAHGTSQQLLDYARNKGLIVIDAVCEDVVHNKEIILEYIDNGYDILYYGVDGHPESQAFIALSDKVHFFSKVQDLKKMKINNDKLMLTNQTTMSLLDTSIIFSKVKEFFPSIVIQKEICNATTLRQQAIIDIKDCDLLYVVGDIKSNNTNKLVQIAKNNPNIRKTLFISSYKEINKVDLNVNTVMITAGTSTPIDLVNEVFEYLKSITS